MEPTLRTNDLAVVSKQRSYQEGDIVAFRVEGDTVIHRIVGGNAEEGFITQGDNKKDPDPWRPKSQDIVGKARFHVPGGGRWLLFVREPVNLGILVGGLATLSLLGGGEMKRRWTRNRRGGSRTAPAGRRNAPNGRWPAPPGLLLALAVVTVVALALTAAAVYSLLEPAQKTETVERLRYEHTAAFDYTAQVQPSSLYPNGVIGPVLPPPVSSTSSPQSEDASARPEPVEGRAATVAAPSAPSIYSNAAQSLDLGVSYNLKSSAPPDVSGEYSAALQIKAGEQGWTKTLPLLPPMAFSGPQASFRVPIDLAQVWSVIDAIEKETDFKPTAYDVSVIPTVRVKGSVGPEPLDAVYAPAFSMKLTRTQITPDAQLTRSEVKSFRDTVTRGQRFNLLGLSLPVTAARWLSSGGAAVALAVAGALAAMIFLGLGQDGAAKIRARYGSLLISVAQADPNEEGQRIQLASMQDLVRLAQRDGRVIFHHEPGPGSHRYFIQDGAVTYQYTLTQPRPEPVQGRAGEA